VFRFENQKIFEISGVRFGGSTGENPTVLIGSIFYGGHRIVEDEKKGIFDREMAEKLITEMEELSDKTGNPGILDVVGMSGEAMKRYVEFISEVTKKPFLIDSASVDVKIETLRFIQEVGLEERVIYNSITPETKERELEELRNSKIKAAIALCYTPNTMSAKARLQSFEALLPKLSGAGIEMPLIDTFVMDVPSLPAATRAGVEIKRREGLPCGSGAHNAVASWRGFKNRFGREAFKYASLTANVYSLVFGLDFVLYGPIEDSKVIFPAVHLIDTSMKYLKRTGEFFEV